MEMVDPAQLRADVDACVTRYIDGRLSAARGIHPRYTRLWEVIRRVYLAGGKRYRPYIMMLSYQACGGTDYAAVLPMAAMMELFHVTLLAIDDIIDRDYQRHGQPNIAGSYEAIYAAVLPEGTERRHYAMSAALLAVNLLLSACYDMVATASLPDNQRIAVMRLLTDAIFTGAGGELLDVEAAFTPEDNADHWLHIARYKTAHYSFITPLVLGAVLADAPRAATQKLTELGEALGVAFQLSDDLLDIFSDEHEMGKDAFSDIEEGKPTYVLTQALAHAPPADKTFLQSVAGTRPITPEQGSRIRAIMERSGARAQTEAQIAHYVALAQAALAQLAFSPAAAAAFSGLIEKAAWRQW